MPVNNWRDIMNVFLSDTINTHHGVCGVIEVISPKAVTVATVSPYGGVYSSFVVHREEHDGFVAFCAADEDGTKSVDIDSSLVDLLCYFWNIKEEMYRGGWSEAGNEYSNSGWWSSDPADMI